MLSFQGGPKGGDGGVWEEIPGGWMGRHSLTLEKTPKKNTFSASEETSFLLTATSIFQEYVTEERLEVPVEFDEGINNLLKKIEVVTSLKFIL